MDNNLDRWEDEREDWTRQEKQTRHVLGTEKEKADQLREVLHATEAENRQLKGKVNDFAGQLASVNAEIEALTTENALLHYNLGVIYTDRAMYSQAVREFEQALERDPNDPHAAYNLGIIYSQYVVDEEQAVAYFKRYLKAVPAGDKDADLARKYIMTRDSYGIDAKI